MCDILIAEVFRGMYNKSLVSSGMFKNLGPQPGGSDIKCNSPMHPPTRKPGRKNLQEKFTGKIYKCKMPGPSRLEQTNGLCINNISCRVNSLNIYQFIIYKHNYHQLFFSRKF